MIIDVKKYLFVGTKRDLDAFFHRAQERGFIEFIPASDARKEVASDDVQRLVNAIKVLKKLPVVKPYEREEDPEFALKLATDILVLKSEIEKCREEKRLLEAEISRVAPFGDFSMQDIDYIENETKRKIQFFCMKTAKSHQTNFGPEVIYVGTVYDLDYFLTINRQPQAYPGMIEMRIDRSLGELSRQLQVVQELLHVKEKDLKEYAVYLSFLKSALLNLLNYTHLKHAKEEVSHPIEGDLFATEAWVPKNKVALITELLDEMAIHAEEIAVEEQDRMPTYMENAGVGRIGQDLVLIYDTPATTDKDPSRWIFWAFILFFSMIVADAGYGLLYLGLALFLRWKFPDLKGLGKRMLKLFAVLASGCIVWGVLIGGYFGLPIDPQGFFGSISPLRYLAEKKADYHVNTQDDVYQYWVSEYPDLAAANSGKEFLMPVAKTENGSIKYEIQNEFMDNILMELSLFIGIIHVSLSLLRYLRRNLAGIGWVTFLVGGYLYFPSILQATSFLNFLGWVDKETATMVGKQLLEGGIIAALALALIQKRWKGCGEIANIVSVFADVLSYLRLYALALASSIMASTFNEQGAAIGFAFGAFVLLLGHGINLVLGTMGGVIHGLRLNFLEWYHYCFNGGGRLFNPLKRLK